jgi:O-antigen/teichoic acid export membrane protein
VSLLRFAAQQPQFRWRYVDQVLLLTFASSVIAIGCFALLNELFPGAFMGEFMLPIALYVLFFVNFDFWEQLWLTEGRTGAVFALNTGRLIARVSVVTIAAAITSDADTVIWSLIVFEGLRVATSGVCWFRQRDPRVPKVTGSWREQLQFSLPVAGTSIVMTINRTMGSLYVSHELGPVGLAQYAIGTYVAPFVTILRNSMSDVLLPDMSAEMAKQNASLHKWKAMTVMAAILLVPVAVGVGRFAEIFVTTFFSEQYRAAVGVFQIYLLTLIREIIDFPVVLRAMNRTSPVMTSNFISMVFNALLLVLLLPRYGIVGSAIAFVIAQTIEGIYLGWRTLRISQLTLKEMARWGDLGKVFLAALLACVVILPSFWTNVLGFAGALLAGVIFLIVYGAILIALRIPEAVAILAQVRRVPAILLARAR